MCSCTLVLVHMFRCRSLLFIRRARRIQRETSASGSPSQSYHTRLITSSPHLILFWMKSMNHFLALIQPLQYLLAWSRSCDMPGFYFNLQGTGIDKKNPAKREWMPFRLDVLTCLSYFFPFFKLFCSENTKNSKVLHLYLHRLGILGQSYTFSHTQNCLFLPALIAVQVLFRRAPMAKQHLHRSRFPFIKPIHPQAGVFSAGSGVR